MKFIILNISIGDNKLTETEFDLKLLKEIAFSSKMKSGNRILYNWILVPYLKASDSDEFKLARPAIGGMLDSVFSQNQDYLYSIFKFFQAGGINIDAALEKGKTSIDIVGTIDDSKIGISYSDGSFKKATGTSSYAVFKLLEENEDGLLDDFTGRNMTAQSFSGTVPNSTNNIGELTAIKVAIENMGSQELQIIISDSEYSVKTFREWYYNWKNNGFKNYAKKPIANKDLIVDTFNTMVNSKKMVLFKWTKGHDKNTFNEECDKLAKDVLGIK